MDLLGVFKHEGDGLEDGTFSGAVFTKNHEAKRRFPFFEVLLLGKVNFERVDSLKIMNVEMSEREGLEGIFLRF